MTAPRSTLPPSPFTSLLEAVAQLDAGQLALAAASVARATDLAPGSAVVRVLAARVRGAMGDAGGAALELDEASRAPGAGAVGVIDHAFDLLAQLGCHAEAEATIERAIAAHPADARRHVQAARFLATVGDHEGALRHIEASRSLGLRGPALFLLAADTCVKLGRDEAARAWIDDALALAPGSEALALDAAEALIDAGALDAAEACAGALATRPGANARALALVATLRLWRGDLDGAEALAARALEANAAAPDAARVVCAVALLRGDAAGALAALDRAITRSPDDPEAHVLRAEALLALGRPKDALAAADRARDQVGEYPAAALVRMLAHLRAHRMERGRAAVAMTRYAFEDVACVLEAVCPGEDEALDGGDPARLAALIARALARLGGNRSTRLTGRLGDPPRPTARITVTQSARFAAKAAQWRIRTAPQADALRLLDGVIEAHPRSSLPACYKGELYLWLGLPREARAAFERAIAQDGLTRYAYIGLSAVALLEGCPREALTLCERGAALMPVSAPPLFAHRGEALLHAGEIAAARADLEHACRVSPTRVSAWLNLALAHGEAGDDGAAREAFEALVRQAPTLMFEAARDEGASIFTPPGAPCRASIARRALGMMRGNRSSTCVTYFTSSGQLRVVPAKGHGRAERDQRDRLRASIERAAGLRRR